MLSVVQASPKGWQQAAEAVGRGLVVAFPTDTVYGVGCNAFEVQAIKSIYRLKGRSARKALPLLLSSTEQLHRVATETPDIALTLGAHFWPGALTLVLKRKAELPAELTSDDTIAVRVPHHTQLRDFIEACGGFLATTSANLSGQPDAQTAQEVATYFKSGLALVVDGGPASGGRPSTVIDCSQGFPSILREGAIARQDIEQVLHMEIRGPNV